jgi:metallo-beta-lactamase class B
MKPASLALLLISVSTACVAQSLTDALRQRWSQPVDPFHIIGNIHYVGTNEISSHIIVTDEGLILLDTGTTLMTSMIQANVEKLGHAMTDIKYIISSHAHWDHVEGHAAMKKITGAQIVASGEDAASIASGVDTSALAGDGWTPVAVDRTVEDGERLILGTTTLTAHHTPGHTKGCTTWTTTVTEGGQSYDVVFIGGTSVNGGVKLRNNTRHPTIAEDYASTFAFLKTLKPDVFLAQHPSMYGMKEKRMTLVNGAEKNPFINPDEYTAFVANEEAKYLERLANEKP